MPDAPLRGVTVIVTRALEQAEAFSAPLVGLGAEVVLSPTIRFEEPADWAPADAALRAAPSYDRAIFTSANAVAAVGRRLSLLRLDWRVLERARVVAIGPATAEALEAVGVGVVVVPEIHQAEGILAALAGEKIAGRKVLLARAEVARNVLPDVLRERGAHVDVVAVYRTVPVEPSHEAVSVLTDRPGPSVVVNFTSSSIVRHFLGSLPNPALKGLGLCVLAAIGPITAADLRRLGFEPRILPTEFTVPALVQAIREHFERR